MAVAYNEMVYNIKADVFLKVNALEKFLCLDGLEYLSSGNFSRAYKTKQGTVIKITIDEIYYKFAQYCKENPAPYLPRILKDFGVVAEMYFTEEFFDISKRKYTGEVRAEAVKIYAVELPMFESCSDEPPKSLESFGVKHQLKSFMDWHKHQEMRRAVSAYLDIQLKGSFVGIMNRNNWSITLDTAMGRYKRVVGCGLACGYDALKFVSDIHAINQLGGFGDLHVHNMMYDPEISQYVITDPVGSNNSGALLAKVLPTYKDLGNVLNKEAVKYFAESSGKPENFVVSSFMLKMLQDAEDKLGVVKEQSSNCIVDVKVNKKLKPESLKNRIDKFGIGIHFEGVNFAIEPFGV